MSNVKKDFHCLLLILRIHICWLAMTHALYSVFYAVSCKFKFKVFSLDGCIAQACFFCQDETKKVTEQIQDSCSVDDGNVFDQGIGDSGCQNILVIKRS